MQSFASYQVILLVKCQLRLAAQSCAFAWVMDDTINKKGSCHESCYLAGNALE
jgi:hypothetical protein